MVRKRANPVSCLVSNSITGSKVVKQVSPPKKNPKVQSKLNNLVQKMPIFIFVIRYLVNTLNIAAQNGMKVDDFVEILKTHSWLLPPEFYRCCFTQVNSDRPEDP